MMIARANPGVQVHVSDSTHLRCTRCSKLVRRVQADEGTLYLTCEKCGQQMFAVSVFGGLALQVGLTGAQARRFAAEKRPAREILAELGVLVGLTAAPA